MNTRYFDKYNSCLVIYVRVIIKMKGVKKMKTKNLKIQSAKMLAKAALKMGKISANSACAYIYHQPKMPDELKTLKKK